MARTAHAAVLDKQVRAIALYGEGCSYDDIAEQLGYANRGSAWKAVDRGLRAERDVRAGDYLQTQIARYEAILSEWWEKATTRHDAKAANIVLSVLGEIDKLMGLDRLEKRRGSSQLSEPLGVVLTPAQRARWEAEGSLTSWAG